MTWSKRAVLAAALVVSVAAPAFAQVSGHPIEVSGNAGMFAFDTRALIKDAPAYGLALGVRLSPWITFEIPGQVALSTSKVNPDIDHNFAYVGGDIRWTLRPAENQVVPYVLTGVGYGMSHSAARDPEKVDNLAGSLGLGLLYNLGSPRTYVRLQVRDVMMRDRTFEMANHFAVTAGVQYALRGKYRDQDLDGVRDWLDKCPNTPIGAVVDANGCPLDGDKDGVFDGIDKCPDTPAGCTVDKTGCSVDTDGDGVCDGIDQCADTPKGATVDAKGCPGDSDGDGVLDGLDQCPNTPKGAVVDEKGCPKDSDGDGVPDGLDKCPDTEAGLQVDPEGCVIEVVAREIELMDTGMIRLQNVNFETGKADILDASKPALDVAGQVLTKWPTLKVEIGGHTDSRGTAKSNLALSEARVKSVLDYLLSTFPELKKSQFVAKGYGASRPIADNTTEAGMAANRRVEFVVLNKGELKREIERRRLLKKGENAPGDSIEAPPAPVEAPADTTGR